MYINVYAGLKLRANICRSKTFCEPGNHNHATEENMSILGNEDHQAS